MEVITSIRLVLDFMQAVNGLPAGFLWSGKLQPFHTALAGTISAVIGLYQYFSQKYMKKLRL